MATKNIYPELLKILQQNQSCILATVIRAEGSTPQVPGSSAVIGVAGLLAGTVGGGPAEYQVLLKSQSALASNISEILPFNLTGMLTEGSDSICGGQMDVLLDASPEIYISVWTAINDSMTRHVPGVLLSLIEETHSKSITINRFWITSEDTAIVESIPDLIRNTVLKMLLTCTPGDFRMFNLQTGVKELHNFACFETIVPPPSLVIAGAGHVGKALARLGKFLGFEVTVWDDRPEYANKTNIPDADIFLIGSVDEGPGILKIKGDFFLVIVTRGHKNDAEVLKKWIKSDAAYIGMMGSSAKVAQMRQQFLELGWASPEEWDRVYTPIGFKIGAKTVEELAVCIAAQLVQVRNMRKN